MRIRTVRIVSNSGIGKLRETTEKTCSSKGPEETDLPQKSLNNGVPCSESTESYGTTNCILLSYCLRFCIILARVYVVDYSI